VNDYQNRQQPAPTTRERRCTDCGALVSDEHIALAKETGQEPYCPDCWGESLVWAEGKELEDLKQWEASINERRAHYAPFGEEPTVRCDFCNKLLEAADAASSAYNGKPLCGRCKDLEEAER
jgi:formylmethanofuran dehydrogenase subunit E